jgi:prepilin-type N-terminal cleavage/methylation domain-containing protein
MRISRHLRHLGQAGFTLIEVMIALLIGIIGIVVMMQTFAVSEGFKRTATSGTDAQINGGVALYMLEREIRNAGYGMNALMQMGCPSVRLWNSATGTGLDLQFYPFEINPAGVPAGDANTDVLLVSYGNASSFVAGVPADQAPQATATAITPFTVTNWDGFHNGDLFVSVMPGAGPGGTASCVMHEATATSPASGNCGGGVPPAPTKARRPHAPPYRRPTTAGRGSPFRAAVSCPSYTSRAAARSSTWACLPSRSTPFATAASRSATGSRAIARRPRTSPSS